MLNVRRKVIPTPFKIGPLTCYLILEDPITLIDCGPNTQEARETLQGALEEEGLTLRDIQRIILTHAHPDHCGLATSLQRESRAQVFMHPGDVKKGKDRRSYLLCHVLPSLKRGGLPPEIQGRIRAYFQHELQYFLPLENVITVEQGYRFSFINHKPLVVYHTPGHTFGSISLYHEEDRILFSGDVLLKKIVPVSFVEPEGGPDILGLYLRTLKRILALPIDSILPGHGNSFSPQKVILDVFQYYEKKEERIRETLRKGEKLSAFQILQEGFKGRGDPATVYLILSRILTTLDHLQVQGRIVETSRKGVSYYHIGNEV